MPTDSISHQGLSVSRLTPFLSNESQEPTFGRIGRIGIARPFGLDNARLWMSALREAFRLDYTQPQNLMPLVRGQGLSSWLPACFSAVVARPDYIAEEAFDETDFLKAFTRQKMFPSSRGRERCAMFVCLPSASVA